MANNEQPELSRIFELGELPERGTKREIVASAEELKALQARYGVLSLQDVGGKLEVNAADDGGVRVTGQVWARLTQNCVVTLEPIEEVVEEAIAVTYLPEGKELPDEEEEIDPFEEEEFEVLSGENLDLGELIAEQIAAAINPYPRKDGAKLGKVAGLGDNEPVERENPFAVLGKLKGQAGNDNEN